MVEGAHNSYSAPIPLFIKVTILLFSISNMVIYTATIKVKQVIKDYMITLVSQPVITLLTF